MEPNGASRPAPEVSGSSGSSGADPWSFTVRTAPFVDPAGGQPAVFSLRQVDDDRFTLTEGFTYDDGVDRVEVSADTLVDTDLASIPLFMAWFVPVNGRHTPAALVHDTLVADCERARVGGVIDRHEVTRRRSAADAVFLRAMAACDVPLLRRRLMHAAVTIATRWSKSGWARIAIAVWALASVVGTVALVWALVVGSWPVAAAAVVAPVVAAPLWSWPNRLPATLAGYAAWFIAVPALATALGYSAYWLAEQVLRIVQRSYRRGRPEPTPPPAPFR